MFKFKRPSAPAMTGTGFRTMGNAGSPASHHWPLSAIGSCLFALAGLRYTIHNWHHPYQQSPYATPLIVIAILLGAWNRFSRTRR